jgi:predicted DNA-binding transcriptional regulator YafY
MPANKNALIRYKTIDNCLRNRYRRWTLDDLVEACCDALYEFEGITKGVSVRTVQSDIQMMRSDKLGYNAPIEVYEHKFYRYADPDFSITDMPLSQNDCEVMQEAVDMLRQLQDFEIFTEMSDVINKLQDKLAISKSKRKPIIHFDSVPDLKGLKLLTPLYNYIAHKQPLRIMYRSFTANESTEYFLHPYSRTAATAHTNFVGTRVSRNLPASAFASWFMDIPPVSFNAYNSHIAKRFQHHGNKLFDNK